jgi:hypothetical protein
MRVIFIVVFWFLSIFGRKISIPAAWMLHYLLGSGKSQRVPRALAREGLVSALAGKARWEEWGSVYNGFVNIKSVDYDGRGFADRPTLFYLVGGFTMRVKAWGELTMSGMDVYDWHGNDEGRYYVSPVGTPNWVLNVLDFLTGRNEYFIHEKNTYCSITGEVGISNKLWMALEWVGAKPFVTKFSTTISWEDWWKITDESN